MNRTTVVLPEELKLRAKERARKDGIPFAELVRQAIESRLEAPGFRPQDDPLFGEVPVHDGPVPPSLSEDHDDHLYGKPA